MVQHEVTRTLVKSQPEVWAQCSDPESLERHLSGSFGEIRITRLEPEHSVAWESEQVRGTVKIESSAWGTRVTMAVELEPAGSPVAPLTARGLASSESAPPTVSVAAPAGPEVAAPVSVGPALEEPGPAEPPVPEPLVEAEPPARPAGFFSRLRARLRPEPLREEPPAKPPEPPPAEIVIEASPPADEQPPPPDDEPPAAQEPAPPPATPENPPEPDEAADAAAVLSAALESLGQAHHRPYSRS